ncbi:MarR family winged helix-turn-helix transcriptional regulator [Thermoflavimicrobium dichotomicum]|uniref:DNA-binding transcriptional regulator, MarR family n=1 Tax=Thermoflavimicrobium dichotomicum TaxID=46223 RepID=A0A1I3RD01_9BACL|nr:MarR family transcriptional regulator [Thermoflavimicrobium dichotomicum]SFJ43076.1 DNA-binding transcriptional regulator, MarR family [Thermoflavimicrobium dichotomicum]
MSEEKHRPLSPETVNEIERLLREMSIIVKRKGREILHHFPITPPQFNALLWLEKEGDLTIGELSQKMYLACSTMTDLIDRMEKNQLVARVRDERDRRVVRIHLLERGSEIIKEVLEARRQYLAEVLSHISEDEAIEIKKHLAILYHEMKDI